MTGREAGERVAEHLTMTESERFDPLLLAKRESHKEPELNELRCSELTVQLIPSGVVGPG